MYILSIIFSGNPVLFGLLPEKTKSKGVCEVHFDPDSFAKGGKGTTAKSRTLLRKDAVPKPYKPAAESISSDEKPSVEAGEENLEVISIDEEVEDSPEIINLQCNKIVGSDESLVELD